MRVARPRSCRCVLCWGAISGLCSSSAASSIWSGAAAAAAAACAPPWRLGLIVQGASVAVGTAVEDLTYLRPLLSLLPQRIIPPHGDDSDEDARSPEHARARDTEG